MQINGEALKAIRIRSGLSLAALNELTGIDPATLSRLEAGKRRGTPAQHKALADALQVPMIAIGTPAVPA
jgi:transcriptional regulator with XRE-family HTH domain